MPDNPAPAIDLDIFIYEHHQQYPAFPIINGFIQIQEYGEFESEHEWRNAMAEYINANLNGWLAEVCCYPSTEMGPSLMRMASMPVFTPQQQQQVISDCLNMKHPSEQEVELVRCYGTQQQYAKIKLRW